MRTLLFTGVILALGGLLLHVIPAWDLAASALFFSGGVENAFPLSQNTLFLFLHKIAVYGGRILGLLFLAGMAFAFFTKRRLAGLDTRAFLFLFLALVVGPGFVANTGFKDHWHRARPHMVHEFGGTRHFTPALLPSDQCDKNCSFVAGDGAFGFFLVAFAFVAQPALAQSLFWLGLSGGFLFGLNRVVMGAHFLSDVFFAGFFMLITTALLYTLLYRKTPPFR